MAKRKTTRRQRSGVPRQARPESTRPSTPTASYPSTAAAPLSSGSTPTSDEELKAEYRYVLTDLRRIGVTAAAMFALLIVLALVIT